MPRILLLACLGAALAAAGCTTDAIPGVYRIDIRQGNHLDEAQVAQLRPGMSKRQIRFLLGTPLVEDSFNPNRWDYFYSFREDGELIQRKHVALFFQGEQLARVENNLNPETP